MKIHMKIHAYENHAAAEKNLQCLKIMAMMHLTRTTSGTLDRDGGRTT
jgi:hypothetical protein